MQLSGEQRRDKIIQQLLSSRDAVSGASLAKEFQVSRQVIVQDIALLRAKNYSILSTNRGYVLEDNEECARVFKMYHAEHEVETELKTIVDLGGIVRDVFVYHKVYGVLKAAMNICSRRDIAEYMEELKSGKSTLLMNVTSGYHYHTVVARDEETLDMIQDALAKKGFLAKLQEFEPVDFWNEDEQ